MRLVWRIRLGLFACGILVGAGIAAWRWATPEWQDAHVHLAAVHPDLPTREPAGLQQALSGSDPPLLLDVRTQAEFERSHLPGALHAPDQEQAHRLITAARTRDPDRPVVLYCAVGLRSADLAADLLAAGVTDIAHLRDGIFGWVMNGQLVVDAHGAPTAIVHPYDWRWGRLLPQQFHPD